MGWLSEVGVVGVAEERLDRLSATEDEGGCVIAGEVSARVIFFLTGVPL